MPVDSSVQDLNNLYTKAKSARSKLEPAWYLDLAFYTGEQWMAFAGGRLFRPQMPRSRMTIVDNRVQPIIRKEIARLTKNKPVFTVPPNTPDQEDANAAQLGEQLMDYLWDHLKLRRKRMEALRWSRICGAGFLKPYWDPTIGDKVEVVLRSDGKLLTDEQGAVVKPGSPGHQLALSIDPSSVRTKTVAQGDIKVEVRSPFQIFPDPLAASFEEVEWLIEESIKSPEYVKRRYGVDVKPDTPANPGLIEARMGASFMPDSGSYMGVKIREYWCKPNPTHPRGCRTVWVISGNENQKGGQVGQVLEEDEPFDPMPYVMLTGIPTPGRLWPMSVADALRGPQTELNKVKSQIAENRNRVGNPSMALSRQAVRDPEKASSSLTLPGGIVWIDDIGSPNAYPKVLEAPALPEYVIEEIARAEESMQEISGQHDVTSAQVPPGVTAASAINLLQESDDTMIAPDIVDHEEELADVGSKLLKLAGKFYTDARTIEIGGDNGAWQIYDFRGSMLRDHMRVKVQIGLPKSRAAQQAQMDNVLNQLVQSGNPPHGRQLAQLLEDNDLGAFSKFINDYTRTEEQANSENALLAQGIPLPTNPYDDDEGHLENHQDFERSAHFKRLSPQAQQVHLKHTDEHRQKVQQAQQQQLEQQMMLEGKVNPQMTQAALQDEHELSQMQGLSDMFAKQAQAGQQQQGQAQQQGFDQASAEQSQRQAEEQHQQRMRQQDEIHQHRVAQLELQRQQQAEQHEQRLQQMRQQAKQQPQGGPRDGRRNAA